MERMNLADDNAMTAATPIRLALKSRRCFRMPGEGRDNAKPCPIQPRRRLPRAAMPPDIEVSGR
jgi:hypothetical protein